MEITAVYNYLKKNKFKILAVLALPIILPLFNLLIEMIFNSGTIVGTIIRSYIEKGIC